MRSEPVVPLPAVRFPSQQRSEEHTSELQSHSDLVCRLLLEKKKIILSTQAVTNKIESRCPGKRALESPGSVVHLMRMRQVAPNQQGWPCFLLRSRVM